jgi:hypothetical protein
MGDLIRTNDKCIGCNAEVNEKTGGGRYSYLYNVGYTRGFTVI